MSPKELNQKLIDKGVESAVRYLFRESGNYSAGRFSVGDIHGEPGDSLFVYFNKGIFIESSSGGDKRGDLLELFSYKFGSKAAGIEAAYDFLGIVKPIKIGQEKKKKKEWKKPEKDWTQLTEDSEVTDYLVNERKIPFTVLKKAKVRLKDECYGFVSMTHEETPIPCGVNYISIHRKKVKGKEKKIIHQSENPLSVLYGHDTIEKLPPKDKKKKKGYLVITAGQIDMLSCRAQGITNSVSVPFGESDIGWIENSWDWMLENFDEFYLLFDNDQAGEDYTNKVAAKIGYDRCKKCYLPSKYNDTNDAHKDGYNLWECIDKAADFQPAKLVSAGSLGKEAIERLSKGRREDLGIPFMGWTNELSVNFNIRPKELTIITGYPGQGKSNLLYQLIAYLICKQDQKVVIASLEEDAEDIYGLIMIHALALIYDISDTNRCKAFEAVNELMSERLFFFYHRNQAKFTEVLEAFEFTIRKHGAHHAILDSAAKTDLDIDDKKETQEFTSKLTSSMNQTGAHYWLVAHSRKGDDRSYNDMPGLQEIKGDGSIGVQAFNCITIWRNSFKDVALAKNKESGGGGFNSKRTGGTWSSDDIKSKASSVLWVSKQKVGGKTGRYDLFYDESNYRMHRTPELETESFVEDIVDKYITNPTNEDEEEDY